MNGRNFEEKKMLRSTPKDHCYIQMYGWQSFWIIKILEPGKGEAVGQEMKTMKSGVYFISSSVNSTICECGRGWANNRKNNQSESDQWIYYRTAFIYFLIIFPQKFIKSMVHRLWISIKMMTIIIIIIQNEFYIKFINHAELQNPR